MFKKFPKQQDHRSIDQSDGNNEDELSGNLDDNEPTQRDLPSTDHSYGNNEDELSDNIDGNEPPQQG